jgi:hypothetical protein
MTPWNLGRIKLFLFYIKCIISDDIESLINYPKNDSFIGSNYMEFEKMQLNDMKTENT